MKVACFAGAAVMFAWASRLEAIRQLREDDLPFGVVILTALSVTAAFFAGLSA